MDKHIYTCKACGETIAEVSEKKVQFCPFCGALLSLDEKSPAPGMKELSKLLGSQKYSEILQLTEASWRKDTVALAYRQAAKLFELTQNYSLEVARLSYKTAGFGQRILSIFTGGHAFQNHTVHTEYFNNMGESVKQLAETLSQIPNKDIAGEIACNAVMILIGEKSPQTNGESYWMQVAAEQHAAPLLDFINKEQLKTLIDYYSKPARSVKALPVQKQLLTAMEKKLKTLQQQHIKEAGEDK